jgi:hypothetical protein
MGLKSFILTLAQTFGWHPSRCETFSCFVVSLIDQRNIQHHALCLCFKNTTATLKSQLERVRRFFVKQEFDYDLLAKNMVLHMFKRIPKMDLILGSHQLEIREKQHQLLSPCCKSGIYNFSFVLEFPRSSRMQQG